MTTTVLNFVGPGHTVAVGYMDPGNWATDIAAGSQFGYAHLTVILISNFIAMFIQILALRLGAVAGRDLAQQCRISMLEKRKYALWGLYFLAEVAIIATDMAEVIGSAIAMNLLFGLPLYAGVIITAADVFLVLLAFGTGKKQATTSAVLECIIIFLVTSIFCCFMYLMHVSKIDVPQLFLGYLPSKVLFIDADALLISIGIIGATVMPHNIYLHSALTRDHAKGFELRKALRYSTIDILVTLTIAFVVNSAILIVSAANFNAGGYLNVQEIQVGVLFFFFFFIRGMEKEKNKQTNFSFFHHP